MIKKLTGGAFGPDPTEQHILLLKLTELLNLQPDISALSRDPMWNEKIPPTHPARAWISEVRALLMRVSTDHKVACSLAFLKTASPDTSHGFSDFVGQAIDAVEELKLALELDGRSEIGTAYEAGDVYRFFADLKAIVNKAQLSIMVVDPYFDGGAFDAYLSNAGATAHIQILAQRYVHDIKGYVAKHIAQYRSLIELKSSDELHDRLVFIDYADCWIIGGSIKDAGKKPTYLIPLGPELSATKAKIYGDIWSRAAPIA